MRSILLLFPHALTAVLGFGLSSHPRRDARATTSRGGRNVLFVSSSWVSPRSSGSPYDDPHGRQSDHNNSERWPSYPSVPVESAALSYVLDLGKISHHDQLPAQHALAPNADRLPDVGFRDSPSPPQSPGGAHSFETPITDFTSFAHYFNTLESEGGIVVVLYAAAFCKLCQRATMVYKQIAAKRQPQDPRLTFYRLEVTADDGRYMKPLQISKFPFVQIYYEHECVASFSTGPSHQFRKKVDDTLDGCVKRTPEDWRAVRQQFQSEIDENRRVRKDLMKQFLLP